MRLVIVALALSLAAWPSCERVPEPPLTPPTPSSVPGEWPPANGDQCDAECANLGALKCPGAGPTCHADCLHLDTVLAEHSQNPVDHACVAASKDCAQVAACR